MPVSHKINKKTIQLTYVKFKIRNIIKTLNTKKS